MSFEEKLLRLTTLITGLLVPVVVFWPEAPVSTAVAELMAWVGGCWSATPRFIPFLALLSLFLAARLLTLPILLHHRRVRRDANLWNWRIALVTVWDVLLLFLVVRAVHLSPVGWPAPDASLLWPQSGLAVKLLAVAGIAVAEVASGFGAAFYAQQLFLPLTGMRKVTDHGGSLAEHNDLSNCTGPQLVIGILVRVPCTLLLTFFYSHSPFFLTVLVCFALANVAGHSFAEFVSLWLDWHVGRKAGQAPLAI
jgi:hypothetical protein